MTSSEGFQQHFSIISKFVCCGFYMKKNVAFTLISFAILKWDDCLSVQVPFEVPVQLLLELEPNWLDQNVNKLECRWNDSLILTFYSWKISSDIADQFSNKPTENDLVKLFWACDFKKVMAQLCVQKWHFKVDIDLFSVHFSGHFAQWELFSIQQWSFS